MNNFKIALIGECMIELQEVQQKRVLQTFGGDTLNTAIYMTRLSQGLPVQVDYVTAVGTDTFSKAMMAFWEKEGVGSSLVQCVKGKRPGLYYIQLDENGERFFHYWRGEAAVRQCFEYPESEQVLMRLAEYDAVYLSGISLAVLKPKSLERLFETLEKFHADNKKIFFDCNYRSHLWSSQEQAVATYNRIFSISHTVFLDLEEGTVLLNQTSNEQIHQSLHALKVNESVVRDGSRPCSIMKGKKMASIPARKVDHVCDTTAAGDSFSAAYLLARQFGHTINESAVFAHRLAASVIAHNGAVAPLEAMPFKKGYLAEKQFKADSEY